KFISDQENDSHVVNLSGRQRMLSQQISKCVLILGTPIHEEKRKQSLKELEMALQEWIETHQGLNYGSETLIKKGGNSKKIEELFVPVHLHHQKIADAAEEIIQKLTKNINLPPESIQTEINTITTYEGSFLRDMDLLVSQYDNEAKTK